MNPYQTLPEHAFWATGVARRHMFEIDGVWQPKFGIDRSDGVVTFGSCFAQHIGRALRDAGFNWLITEPAPKGLSPENKARFNYDVFSARTGNLYTASLLHAWLSWAAGISPPPREAWTDGSRCFDPVRPAIEPGGFASVDEMFRSRDMAIEAFRSAATSARLFVFTLGLTESWWNTETGFEYPMCPGTVAGTFDPLLHRFVNQDYPAVLAAMTGAIELARSLNPSLRFLLTVSPVPLTATMSGRHVLAATTQSKSVLRAVAGTLADTRSDVDYCPSYELIVGTPFRGVFYAQNQRNVSRPGVDHVMRMFFRAIGSEGDRANRSQRRPPETPRTNDEYGEDNVICEEALLSAFAKDA